MDEIAIGRKEIMKALHISSWNTVRVKKKKYPGFKRLFKVEPTSNKPMIIISEYRDYITAYNKML